MFILIKHGVEESNEFSLNVVIKCHKIMKEENLDEYLLVLKVKNFPKEEKKSNNVALESTTE